jgi:hypothetical protein
MRKLPKKVPTPRGHAPPPSAAWALPRPKAVGAPRNWLAVLAHRRHAGVMKDRRQARGGSRSWRALAEEDGGGA